MRKIRLVIANHASIERKIRKWVVAIFSFLFSVLLAANLSAQLQKLSHAPSSHGPVSPDSSITFEPLPGEHKRERQVSQGIKSNGKNQQIAYIQDDDSLRPSLGGEAFADSPAIEGAEFGQQSFLTEYLAPPNVTYQIPPHSNASLFGRGQPPILFGPNYNLVSVARAYYINDQRIEWSGQESTFGVEAILAGNFSKQIGSGSYTLNGEFYLNQPFERNIFIDGPERASYAANFQTDIFEISQLSIDARWGDIGFSAGRMVTPFGRSYFPIYQNSRQDAPFIRTESILWRETGMLLQYDPGNWSFAAGLMNGGYDRDTNSSKALVARAGYDSDFFAIGGSVKHQDGTGSEGQKQFRNHVGMDIMIRRGPFQASAEIIYDEYGFRRPGYHVNDIFWGRSIYYRDFNGGGLNKPITGLGYYVNLGIELELWHIMLNYGEFYPNPIGRRLHDITTRRGIVKCIRRFESNLEIYSMLLVENDVQHAQTHRHRRGIALLAGVQFAL